MKSKKALILKTALSLALAISILTICIVTIFASGDSKPKDIDSEALAPELETNGDSDKVSVNDGTSIVSREEYAERFGVYTHISVEDEKSVATIFSDKQILDISRRRSNGEWMLLTGEEALYLLDDTMKLFESYDIVRITDINGTAHSFRGVSFYSSDEYKASFNGILTGSEASDSFDLKRDVYEAMLYRIEALHCGVNRESISGHGEEMIALTGLDSYMSQSDIYFAGTLAFNFYMDNDSDDENLSASLKRYDTGALMFYQERIYYVSDLSRASKADLVKLYPDSLFGVQVGNDKYDINDEKVVIIEVWEEASKSCVAKIRLDSSSNPQQIEEIQALWTSVENNITGAPVEEYETVTDYRVAVYLNGFDSRHGEDIAMRYHPDGNLDLWAFLSQDDIFQRDFLYGSEPLATYINTLLIEHLAEN